MSTIDSKAMIDAMIALDGYYGQDPRVAMIVEYLTPEGKTTWGVTWCNEPLEEQGRYLVETEFIRRPRIIWQGNVVPGTPHDNTGRDDTVTVDKMAAELQPLGPMELVVSPLTVLQLAGLLQLANRHPDIQAPSRNAVARFLDGARQYFASCPTVLEVLRKGDRPEFDRHRDDLPAGVAFQLWYSAASDDASPIAIRCGTCGAVSHHPNDIAHRYCGRCHRYHDG